MYVVDTVSVTAVRVSHYVTHSVTYTVIFNFYGSTINRPIDVTPKTPGSQSRVFFKNVSTAAVEGNLYCRALDQ